MRTTIPKVGGLNPASLFSLKGRVAVVIGAGGALGGAIAHGFAEAGAKVAVLDYSQELGEQRVRLIQQHGGEAEWFLTNATFKPSLEAQHESILKNLGEPSILLNAVGGNHPTVTVTPEQLFENIKLEDWMKNYDLNLVAGALLPCQVFGPAMCKRGQGSIINIASVNSHIPLSKVVAYSAAKAAVLNLTQFLAREWAPKGVRVNSITPGFFPAAQNMRLLFNEDGTPTDRGKAILAHTPMGRLGVPEELVGAALFLASPLASSFVTGADIVVDGGFLHMTI